MTYNITQDFRHDLSDQATVLQKIVADKADWIEQQSEKMPLDSFQNKIKISDRSFYCALAHGTHKNPAYILECKKASPSKGLIRKDFDPKRIAQTYKNYATAISVLTDNKYFQGDFKFIKQVRDVATQPVLCKDFMISEYQVYLARYAQADAILLMLSIVNDETYRCLSSLAHKLGMGVLTETSNDDELQRSIDLDAKVIGINNRNLRNLTVDLSRTPTLATKIPQDRIIISESGIYHHQQIRQLKSYVHAFLIGSSLMSSDDLNSAIRSVIFGENKVCGLTREQDAQAVYENGALYGGLIFVNHSKRCVQLKQAKNIMQSAPLRYIGVFQNNAIAEVVKISQSLKLHAIQLHGSENIAYIEKLRSLLPDSCKIWKAISIDTANLPNQQKIANLLAESQQVDRFVLDSRIELQQGGTGKSFDWSIIPEQLKQKIMLAGGLNLSNVSQALEQNCLGLDLNSGVEIEPGIKDAEKIKQVFSKIIAY